MNPRRPFYGVICLFAFASLAVFAAPEAFADSLCDASHEESGTGYGYQYLPITPTNHTITSGNLLSFCAEPDHLWYKIHLDDVTEPGSLTVTIPKDAVDLKQHSIKACQPNNLDVTVITGGGHRGFNSATVKQISENKDSRTLEFSWNTPISLIDYYGGYVMVGGISHSQPGHCIDQKTRAYVAPDHNEEFDEFCLDSEIKLNHTLGTGEVKRFCSLASPWLLIQTQNITSDTILTVDVPYTVLPLVTTENKYAFSIFLASGKDIPWNPDKMVTHQYPDYQTFELHLPANSQFLYFIVVGNVSFDHERSLTIPLLEIEDPDKGIEKSSSSSCRSSFVSLLKHDHSRSVCVKPATVEKLISRGWGVETP